MHPTILMGALSKRDPSAYFISSLATGQISQVEYSLMDRWFKLNSKAFEKFVKPDIIGSKVFFYN